jgi:hypothetical protein
MSYSPTIAFQALLTLSGQPRAPDMESCQLGCAPGPLEDSYVEGPVLSQAMRDQFAGFTYNRPIFKDPSSLDGSDRS